MKQNNVLVWLDVELVISLKTFMLIHNEGAQTVRIGEIFQHHTSMT